MYVYFLILATRKDEYFFIYLVIKCNKNKLDKNEQVLEMV